MGTFNQICVIGLGYIGLPTAAVFANSGVQVIGVHVNPTSVDLINQGKPHFCEPNLDAMVRQVVQQGKLKATHAPCEADVFVLAVPTPFQGEKQPDMSYVKAATLSVAPFLKKGNLVILESTSPVGSTEMVSEILAQARPDLTFPHQEGDLSDIRVAHCPERVLPGKILHEVVHNARVIGGISRKCAQMALAFYKIVVKGECHLTNARTAEMAKLTENAFRDVNIAFANELSMICDKLDINVWELIHMANLHPRVNILSPGPGVGGHCIAVDPWFIVAKTPEEARLIRTAREINDHKPHYIVQKILQAAAQGQTIACLGLSYKADVDDLRESPAVEIVEALSHTHQGDILVVEPHVSQLPSILKKENVQLVSFDDALKNAEVVVLLVDHRSFLMVNSQELSHKIVIDTRGCWQ